MFNSSIHPTTFDYINMSGLIIREMAIQPDMQDAKL